SVLISTLPSTAISRTIGPAALSNKILPEGLSCAPAEKGTSRAAAIAITSADISGRTSLCSVINTNCNLLSHPRLTRRRTMLRWQVDVPAHFVFVEWLSCPTGRGKSQHSRLGFPRPVNHRRARDLEGRRDLDSDFPP